MNKEEFFIVLAFIAIVAGVFILCGRYNGGNGGQGARAIPSGQSPGGSGWRPGFVSTMVLNGGRGASTPNVSINN